MKSRKKRGTLWFVEGQPWTYRHPFEQGGKWRARRRNRATGAVEKVTLNSKTLTAARSEIQAMADEERRFAPATAAPVGDSPSTVRGALDAWLQTLDVRPATMATYRLDAALYGRLLGEERPMRSLAYADVEALFSGPWRDLAGRTKIKHRALLARFFGWALKHKLAAANYAEMVEVQKRWSKESSDAAQETGQALTLEEARKLAGLLNFNSFFNLQ